MSNAGLLNSTIMKLKISLLLSVLLLALTCTSCGGDDEPGSPSLEGTSWSSGSTTSSEILVIEFTSPSEVVGYLADANGNPTGSVSKGSYSFDGSKVSFSDFTVTWVTLREHFVDGSVSGNLMTLSSWWEMGGQRHNSSTVFRKR